MDAIEFLKTEHQLIAESMDIILRSYSSHRKGLARRLTRQVAMHDHVELRIFYAAVPDDLLSRSSRWKTKDNRQVVGKSLTILTCHPSDAFDWLPFFETVRSLMLRQMEDEEQNTLAMIRDKMGRQELFDLGSRMLAEKERLELVYVMEPDEPGSDDEQVQAGTSFSMSVRWETR